VEMEGHVVLDGTVKAVMARNWASEGRSKEENDDWYEMGKKEENQYILLYGVDGE
jgi:hypothetical protein